MQLRALFIVLLVGAVACSDDDSPSDSNGSADAAEDSVTEDASSDIADDTGDRDDATDGGGDAADDTDEADTADGDDDAGDASDATDDAGASFEPLAWSVDFPIVAAPENPLGDESSVASCAVYQEQTCDGGALRRCEVYDVESEAFVDDPDPLLHRVLLYERWYDLYSSPDGQTGERLYDGEMPADATEEEWTDPDRFLRWAGAGDSAIWSGTALNGYILRYLMTGTEADYERMEEKVLAMLHKFDVTGVPGYLARYHYLLLPPGAPQSDDHIFEVRTEEAGNHMDNAIENPEELDFLPDVYLDGVVDADGERWEGTPMWNGAPTIDQMNGPMVAFPLVYGLLRDDSIKERIVHHMTCYLKRLRRIEIINVRENDTAFEALTSYFGGDSLQLDPDDIDFEALSRIVMYVHPQMNSLNADTYDRSCPDELQLEPWRTIDLAEPDWFTQLFELVEDMDAKRQERAQSIDHFYVPTLRGADAMHMMHLAAMAHAFTGEERYATFLDDVLQADFAAPDVAMTMSAFVLPRWCRKFYGTNISVGPLWAFINLLDDSPLRDRMREAMFVEQWQKENANIGNVNFEIMFAGAVPESVSGADRQTAIDHAVEALRAFGGNGGVLAGPRRTYDRTYEDLSSYLSDGNEAICPTEEQRRLCEDGLQILGVQLEARPITAECVGADWECEMDDGLCAVKMASDPMPMAARKYADYLWQRNPFDLRDRHGVSGNKQSPGIDFFEQFWMARWYGFVEEGAGQVLAWREVGACDPP